MVDLCYVTVGLFIMPNVILPQRLLLHGVRDFRCLLYRVKLASVLLSLS